MADVAGRLIGEVVTYIRLHPELSTSERLVLLLIADRANLQSREAWPGGAVEWDLGHLAGLGPTGLRSVLQRLARRGLEVRVPRGKDKKGRIVYAGWNRQTTFRLPILLGDDQTSPVGDDHVSPTAAPVGDDLTSIGDDLTSIGDTLASPGDVQSSPYPLETLKETLKETLIADDAATRDALIAGWRDSCDNDPPKKTQTLISREVENLLGEGIDPGHIAEGLQLLTAAGYHPSTLHTFVNKAMNQRSRADENMRTIARFVQRHQETEFIDAEVVEPDALPADEAKAQIRETLRGHRRADMMPYGVAAPTDRRCASGGCWKTPARCVDPDCAAINHLDESA